MSEPFVFGVPISLVFLYFMFYSFLGWGMETTYCSVKQGHYVPRGFLFGPICPIYGVGALISVFFFSRFTDNPLVFYVLATLVMSSWEYFVGWFLETTTHMKYWDYSSQKYNLSGRISLFNSLWWGVLAYFTIFYMHPAVSRVGAMIPTWPRSALAGCLGTLLLVDTVTTIRSLALTTRVLGKLEEVSGELRLQAALGRAELSERLETARGNLSPEELLLRLETARESASRNLDEATERLRVRRKELIGQAERYSRRFRSRYDTLASKRFEHGLADVKEAGEALKKMIRSKNQRGSAEEAGK